MSQPFVNKQSFNYVIESILRDRLEDIILKIVKKIRMEKLKIGRIENCASCTMHLKF